MIRERFPAGFWRRAAALGVDALWLFAVAGTLSWVLFGVALPAGTAGLHPAARVGVPVIHELLPLLVLVVGWARYGATPGKVLLELRVVDARTGARPSPAQALVRALGYVVSAAPLGLGFAWAAIDRDRRALHDRLARTRVVVVAEEILPGVAA